MLSLLLAELNTITEIDASALLGMSAVKFEVETTEPVKRRSQVK